MAHVNVLFTDEGPLCVSCHALSLSEVAVPSRWPDLGATALGAGFLALLAGSIPTDEPLVDGMNYWQFTWWAVSSLVFSTIAVFLAVRGLRHGRDAWVHPSGRLDMGLQTVASAVVVLVAGASAVWYASIPFWGS